MFCNWNNIGLNFKIMYKLVWILDGSVKETIITGSAALCNWKKSIIKSNYKSGLLQVRSENGLKYNLNSIK
jgi:hypothetical protein